MTSSVLSERLFLTERSHQRMREAALVVAGILVLAICAKIKVPVWPSPVPVTLGTFAVL
jgi:biotin transport system substrate-specific component